MKPGPPENVFADIHDNNSWGSRESVSGAGSELANTSQLIRELSLLLRDLRIKTLLDLPCGDFNWMQHVDLAGIDYHGADIVEALVQRNSERFTGPGKRFSRMNLLADRLPEVDLIICRDCLFHFSNDDVFKALHAFVDSNARWLLTTTMIYRGLPRNSDIQTGGWTTINLEMPPYLLPPPKRLLLEGNVTELVNYVGPQGVVQYPQNDRCLGLWPIDDIRDTLARIGR